MAGEIAHTKVAVGDDDGDPNHVQVADWNGPSAHTVDPTAMTAALNTFTSGLKGVVPPSGGGTVNFLRADGNWVGNGLPANVSDGNGDLQFVPSATPTAPATAGHCKLHDMPSAGRPMMSILGPAGSPSRLQPFLGSRSISMWSPKGAVATVDAFGANGPSATGTASVRNPTNANMATSLKRVGYVSLSSAAAVTGARSTAAQFWRGTGPLQGGFHVVFRFFIADPVVVGTARMFVGLQQSAIAPTDVDPSSLSNLIGIGVDTGDATLQLYCADGTPRARTALVIGSGPNTGGAFPANTTNTDVYELAMYASPNSAQITVQITRLNTGDTTTTILTTNLPVNSIFMTQSLWRSNGATAAAVHLDLISFYGEVEV